MNALLCRAVVHAPHRSGKRATKRKHRRGGPFKRYSIEQLERRVVLSNAAISQAEKDALLAGLQGLVQWAQGLDEHGIVGQVLPIIGQALGQSADIGQVLGDRLRGPILSYFNGDTTPTSDELVTALQNLGGTFGNLVVSVDAGANGGLEGSELKFTLGYHADKTHSAKPSFGLNGNALGLKFDSTLNFTSDFDFSFTFGLDLTPGLTVGDAFFIRNTSLAAHADTAVDVALSGGMNFGFFDATMSGTFELDNAGVSVALNDSNGTITLNELTNTPLSTLVSLTPSGAADASINVSASAWHGFLAASGTMSFATATPFTPPQISVSTSLNELKNFANVNSFGLIGLLEQLAGDFGDLGQTSVLGTALHLAGNAAVRNILHLDEVISKEMVDALVDDDTGLLGFDSTQGFVTAVESILGPGSITPFYDPAEDDLIYTLTIDRNFAATPEPFGLKFNISPLISVTSSSQVNASGAATLNLKLGIDLSGLNGLVATADAPGNSQLVAGDADFNLTVGANATPVQVTLTKASTLDNTNLDHLVADMNAALLAAGLNTSIQAGRQNNRLKIFSPANSFVSDLTLTASAGNPILTELHFVSGTRVIDNIANHAYIDDATASASVSVSAPDIDASARLGFLKLDLINGSGSANAAINFALKDTGGTPGGKITFPQLIQALQGPIGSLVDGPNVSGSVDLNLPLKVTGDILGVLPGNPNLHVTWANITQPNTLNLQFTDAQPIRNFEHVNANTIVSALLNLASYFVSLQDSSNLMDQEIPLLNKSIGEVLEFAEDFAAKVGAYQANPAQALQELETFLEDVFDLNDPQLELTFTDNNTIIRVDLDLGREVAKQLPMNFALGTYGSGQSGLQGVGNLFDFQGAGKLDVAAGVSLGLDFGIDISQPTSPKPFIYDTTAADLAARVTGTNIDFSAALGPLGLFVRDATVNVDGDGNVATSADRAHLTLDVNDTNADGKIYLNELSLSNAAVSVTGEAHAVVPVFFPLESNGLGNIALDIEDLGHISTTTTLTHPDFNALFSNFAFLSDLRVVLYGLDFVLEQLELAIREQALGKRLPIVGEDLDEAADFIHKLREQVLARLTARFNTQPDSPTVARQAMFDAFGPGGLAILRDKNNDTNIDINDITMTLVDLDEDGQADDKVDYDLKLGQNLTLLNSPISFDLGLPRLGLTLDGNAQVQLGWDWSLNFGVERGVGFYVNTAAADELQVNLVARIPDLVARGDLFFLQLDITDEDADANPNNPGVDVDGDNVLPTNFGATFKVNLVDPIQSAANKLTYDDMLKSTLDECVDARIDGNADVNLNATVSFKGDARFPSIATDFNLDWVFLNDSTFQGNAPTVAFNNVRLDVGEWVTDFAEEIVRKVRKLTEPLDGIVEFLNTPVPILSTFGINATPLDLAEIFGVADTDFIETVADIINIINNVPATDHNLFVPLGAFDLLGVDVRSLSALLTPHVTQNVNPIAELNNIPAAADEKGFFDDLDDVGMSFPILENPMTIFTVLTGGDADLFLFDIPDLKVKLPFSYKFGPIVPPLPIFGTIAGSIGAKTDLRMGYDTHGLKKYKQTGDTLDVFAGFFLNDLDDEGNDVLEASLTGSLTAGVELNIVVASAEIKGGIFADVGVNLHDPNGDGKVHLDEFLENLDHSFLCTFDFDGTLKAGLELTLESVFGGSKTYPLVDPITLINFEILRDECYDDRFGGNNTLETATDLGVGPGLHVDWLGIETIGDEDWLQFELLKPDSIDVDVRGNFSQGDISLQVYNASHQLLGQSSTNLDRELVRLNNLPAGLYYARVTGARNQYVFAVEPAPTSTTRVIYLNPASTNIDHPQSYYTFRPGSDIYDGLDYTHPKASLASVLATYDLGPNDLVVFDTGVHTSAATITAADETATFVGTPAYSYLSGVVLDDADDNLFYRVGFGGSGTGLTIAAGSRGNVVRRSHIQNIGTGVRVESALSNVIENNFSSGSGTTGILIAAGAAPVVRFNDITGRQVGIFTASKVAQVYSNSPHGNTTGIEVEGGIVGPEMTPAVPNDVYANGTGIYISPKSTGAIVRFNTVRNNTVVGIEARADNSTVIANLVHDNTIGIRGDDVIGPASWESGLWNIVRNNTTGLFSNRGGEFRFNKVYANADGVVADGGLVHHNLIYRNTANGVRITGARGVDILSNTIFAPASDGVRLRNFSRGVMLRNNIVHVQAGYALRVDPDSEKYVSDYNNLFASGSGKVAFQGKDFADLYDFQVEAESDIHSIGRTNPAPTLDDPLFVNAASDDYHLQANSTSINAGDPASPFALEPAPNGGRIDLGAYGNTPGATTSQASWIAVTSPNFYTDLDRTRSYNITWSTFNVSGNVKIELVQVVGGSTVTTLFASVPASASSQAWTPTAITGSVTNRYRIRITSLVNGSIVDESREPFAIVALTGSQIYFVDDGSNTSDEYTTAAIGDNRNTGTVATAPKAAIRPLVLSYPMTATNTVRIDRGTYVHAIDLNLSSAPMSFDPRMQTVSGTDFTGPTLPSRVAQISRANAFNEATAIHVINSDGIDLLNLTITDADNGVHVSNDSDAFRADTLKISAHAHNGLLIEGASDNATLTNLTVFNNGRHGIFVDSLLTSLTSTQTHHNAAIGAALRNVGAAVVQNVIAYNNATGIDVINPGAATAVLGDSSLSFMGNIASDNTADGFFASGNVLVTGSTSFNNGDAGIQLDDGADALRNIVYQNLRGIAAFGSTSDITENRVYAHTQTGIEASFASNIVRNVVYSNGLYGIHTKHFSGLIDHNLVYSTASASMNIQGPGNGGRVINNTVYEPCDDNVDPVGPTEIAFGWNWNIYLERFNPFYGQSQQVRGDAEIQFGQPVGINFGGTFDLGPGGDGNALTNQPVPPGDTYRIPITVENLRMTSAMFPQIHQFGLIDMQLSETMPSVGQLEVTLNPDQTISGNVFIDVFIDFELPSFGTPLKHHVPARLFNSFSSNYNAFQSLQTVINLFGQSFPQAQLFDQHDPTASPWGRWQCFQTFYSPGLPIQPHQNRGTTCAEIGVWVNTQATEVLLRNNIVYVEGHQFLPPPANSHDIVVAPDSTARWNSDFNLLTTTYGNIGQYALIEAPTLGAWQGITNDDRHSTDDPVETIFVDPDGGDNLLGFAGTGLTDGRDDNFHLRSPLGHNTRGANAPEQDLDFISLLPVWAPVVLDPMPLVGNFSPAIDNGDPSYDYLLEPLTNGTGMNPGSNGEWINQGCYGNTIQASLSPTAFVHNVFPIGFEQIVPPNPGRPINLTWRAHGPDLVDTVTIELIGGGVAPTTLFAGTPDDGFQTWTPPLGLPVASDYRIRITRSDGSAAGRTKFPFTIAPDSVPPKVLDSVPEIVHDAFTTNAALSSIRLYFSENLNSPTTPTNYELRSAGGDQAFDTGDDVIYSLNRTYTPNNPGMLTNIPGVPPRTNVLLTVVAPAPPLAAARYRLTAFATPGTGLRDQANLLLDGDGNGVAGGNYVKIFTVDQTAPLVSAIGGVPSPFRNTSVNNVTFTFSEPVRNFGLADLLLTRDGRYQLLTGSQTLTPTPNFMTWTLSGLMDLTADEGVYSLSLAAATSGIVDLAGNPLGVNAGVNWTLDKTPPAVDIANVSPNPRTGSVGSMTITFSEAVTGFEISDLTLTRSGGSNLLTGAQTLTTSDNITFTLNGLSSITTAEGTYLLSLVASTSGITDPATNALAGNAFEAFDVITSPPVAAIDVVTPDPRTTGISDLAIRFSQIVSGFDLADLTLARNGGGNLLTGAQTLTTLDHVSFTLTNLAAITAPAGNYVLTLTAAGSGIVNTAGIALVANAVESWTVDTALLTADVADVAPDPRTTGVPTMSVTFNKPVTGFDIADLILSRSAGPNLLTASQTLSTSDNITYTLGNLLGLTFPEGNYVLTVNASGSGIIDGAGGPLSAAATDNFAVTATSVPATSLDDHYYVRMQGVDSILVYHNTSTSGAPTYTLASATTTLLIFDTAAGNDSLTIDATFGSPVPNLGINYLGGTQTTLDALTVIGGGASGTYTPSATTLGSGTFNIASRMVSFTGLEPVTASDFADLTLITPNAGDVLTIDSPAAGRNRVSGTSGGVAFESLAFFDVTSFVVNAGANDGAGANDTVTIDSSGLVAAGLSSFRFIGAGGNDALTLNGGTLALASEASLDTANLTLNVNADGIGASGVTFNSTQHLAALSIGNGGTATMATNGNRALVTKSLAISATGKLDLRDNDLIVDYTGPSPIGSWSGSSYTGLTGLIQTGQNSGSWNGFGIVTSMADALTYLTTLGIASATDALGISGAESGIWSGQTVDATSVLVKYTYAGDANLDGAINADDYALIDFYSNVPGATGYYNGEFNYDGDINADDYALIDFNNTAQGPPL